MISASIGFPCNPWAMHVKSSSFLSHKQPSMLPSQLAVLMQSALFKKWGEENREDPALTTGSRSGNYELGDQFRSWTKLVIVVPSI